ncbi:MAG: hypothetical protein QOJ13_2961 [Gaiellales bacterium]|nr:hypothetical protein [Gaiellales bacterium]
MTVTKPDTSRHERVTERVNSLPPCADTVDIVVSPPIIIGEPGDVGIFSSAAAVTRNLDAGVADGRYAAFDSEGRRLELVRTRVTKRQLLWRRHIDGVAVSLTEPYPTHQAQLNRMLREHLNSIGDPPLTEATIHDLIERVAQQDGYIE